MSCRWLLSFLLLPLVGCMPTRPTPPPADVDALTQALTAGHTRAQAFLFQERADLRIQLMLASRTLQDRQTSADARLTAARTVRAMGARLDQMIVATALQETRVAHAMGDAQAACQDPLPYLQTGRAPSLAECGRMRLAFAQWQIDRTAVHAARDDLQRQRGDAEAALANSGVGIGPPTPYQVPGGDALACRPANGQVTAPAWGGAAL